MNKSMIVAMAEIFQMLDINTPTKCEEFIEIQINFANKIALK